MSKLSNNTLLNIFLLIMIALYFLNISTKGSIYTLFELDSYKIIKEHQYYRLLSFGFLHGSLIHLVLNILIIKNIIYPFFQNKISFSAFVYIFIFSAAITGIALILYYSKTPFTFVGSSVGFYSFFGLMLVYYINSGWTVFINSISQQPIYNNGLVWAILVFILGSVVTSYWGNFQNFSGLFAHNTSFIVGIILGVLIKFGY